MRGERPGSRLRRSRHRGHRGSQPAHDGDPWDARRRAGPAFAGTLEAHPQDGRGARKQLEVEPRAYRFNRRDIREYTGWSDNQIKAHIGQLEELEYLLVPAPASEAGCIATSWPSMVPRRTARSSQGSQIPRSYVLKLESWVWLAMVGCRLRSRFPLENPSKAKSKVGKLGKNRKRHIAEHRR